MDHEGRRRELADALWRVAARDGLRAATVRSVAAESGWSSGALRHYFPSKSDLLLFAVDHAIEEVRGRIERLRDEGAVAVLEQLLPLDERRRVESDAWFALAVAAEADAGLRRRRGELDTLIRSAVRDVVADLDGLAPHRDPALETRRLHALLDGLVVQAIARPPLLSPGDLRAILTAHLEDLTR